MTAYLLDSNHAGALITVTHPLRQRVTARMAGGDAFCLTLPVVTETVYGFSTLPRARQSAREWAAMRPSLVLIGMDEDDALNAAALQVTLHRQGRQRATIDALIATAALRYELVLLTTDRDFEAIPGLTIENWMQA